MSTSKPNIGKPEVLDFTLEPPIRLTVDYSRSLSEMVAAGKYNRTDGELYPEEDSAELIGIIDTEILLVQFKKDMTPVGIRPTEIEREFSMIGFRAANLHELLAIGEAHPGLQLIQPIIAYGTLVMNTDSHRCVPFLASDKKQQRFLFFRPWEMDWGPHGWFAAVRK